MTGSRMWFTAFASTAVCLATSGPAAAQEGRHEVRFTRAWQAGARLEVKVEGSQTLHREITSGENVNVSDLTIGAKVHGTLEIVRVDSAGRVREWKLLIDEATVTQNESTAPLGQRGSVLRAVIINEDEASYDLDGQGFSDHRADALDLVFTITDSGEEDQGIWGTDERKAVGDAWPPDSVAAAKALRDQVVVEPEGLRGEMSLEEVSEVADEECLHLKSAMRSSDFQLARVPAGMRVDRGELVIESDQHLPRDAGLPALRSERRNTLEAEMSGAIDDGAGGTIPVEAVMNVVVTQKIEARPLE